jgi:hypothetical protein
MTPVERQQSQTNLPSQSSSEFCLSIGTSCGNYGPQIIPVANQFKAPGKKKRIGCPFDMLSRKFAQLKTNTVAIEEDGEMSRVRRAIRVEACSTLSYLHHQVRRKHQLWHLIWLKPE